MPEGTIRPARLEDAPALLAIYAPYVEGSWVTFEYQVPTLEEFRRRMAAFSRDYPYLVYEEEGVPLAYAYAHRHLEREAYRWNAELTLYVREDARGRGIGAALYGALIDDLRGREVVNLYALVALPNPGSEALQRRFGFTRQGLFPHTGFKLGAWHAIAQYALRLRPEGWRPQL